MSKYDGTMTEKNLLKAFAGEAQGRNRYTYYSKVAIKEGYEQIAGLFIETAENELMHAKLFFEFLGSDRKNIEIVGTYPVGLSNTVANLENAFLGEMEENQNLYPTFAKVAREEGFEEVAFAFDQVTKVEIHHEARFRALHQNILEDRVFKRPEAFEWKCRKCGTIIKSTMAPPKCPTCHHPQAWFEISCDNF